MLRKVLALFLSALLISGCSGRTYLPGSAEEPSDSPSPEPLTLEQWWDGYLCEMTYAFQGDYP